MIKLPKSPLNVSEYKLCLVFRWMTLKGLVTLLVFVPQSRRRGAGGGLVWEAVCEGILMEVTSSADAEPFRNPVSLEQAPGQ